MFWAFGVAGAGFGRAESAVDLMEAVFPEARGRQGAKLAGCAWHGHWIGGESPSRGEVVATASWRQLHAVLAVVRRQRWRREAVWGRSPRRTAAPNVSEPLSKPSRPGQRVWKRDAQNPSEAGAVLGAGAAGHSVSLPREVCVGPPSSGRPEGGNDDGTTPTQKSDLLIVARRLVKASGAKEEMD